MTFRCSQRTVVIVAPFAVLLLGLLYTVVIPEERTGATTASLGPVQPGLCQLLELLMRVTGWGGLSTGLSSLGPSPVAAVGCHVILRGLRVFSAGCCFSVEHNPLFCHLFLPTAFPLESGRLPCIAGGSVVPSC